MFMACYRYRRGPQSQRFNNKLVYKTVTSNVKHWMYSWCSCFIEKIVQSGKKGTFDSYLRKNFMQNRHDQ